jgi:hypothetical protein
MITSQPIHHDGEIVAFVVGGRALITSNLADEALAVVRAKCLYALEIATGERPGSCCDGAAAAYARSTVHRRRPRGARARG